MQTTLWAQLWVFSRFFSAARCLRDSMLILRCGVNLGNLHGRPAVVLVNLHGKIVFEDIGDDGILSGLFPAGLVRIHFLEFFEVLPEEDYYPYTYKELTDVAKKEQNEKSRPAYQGTLPDLSAYSTIFIGAPVWWGDWPMIMYTVFENNDFSGKTLIPFSTHEGSGLSGFDKKLQNACPDAEVMKGLAIRGNDAQNSQDKVIESVKGWLKDLGV